LGRAEFELTGKGMELFGLGRDRMRRVRGSTGVREAIVRMDQLVLGAKAREALGMALAQARNPALLMDAWGMGEKVAYGRATTLLFSGDPGTGKTATAEALAAELDRPILVADYSKIQN